jgi:hypothetical protein
MRMPTYVVLVSEDELSEAVLYRLLAVVERDFVVDRSIIARGFGNIKANIQRYRTACKAVPHIVLTDLDAAECAPAFLAKWNATNLPVELLLRVAVREVESWLIADQVGLAQFIGVPANRFPAKPDEAADPKQVLINVARNGRTRVAREIVPEAGSKASIGPLYNNHLIQFARTHWDVDGAAQNSLSLSKAILRLQRFCLQE